MSYSHKIYRVQPGEPFGFVAFLIVAIILTLLAFFGVNKIVPEAKSKQMGLTHLTYKDFQKLAFYSRHYGKDRPIILGSSELSATFDMDGDPYHFKEVFGRHASEITPLVLGSANAHDFFHGTMLAAGIASEDQPIFIFLGVQHFDGAAALQETYKDRRFDGTTADRFKMHLNDTLVERASTNLWPHARVAEEYAHQALRFVTKEDNPVLFRYLQHLGKKGPDNEVISAVIWPIIQAKVFGEDYRELVLFIKNEFAGVNPKKDSGRDGMPPLPTPDEVEASRDDIIELAANRTSGNDYGIGNGYWEKYMKPTEEWLAKKPEPNSSGPYVSMDSSEWADYELLAEIIQAQNLNVRFVIPPIQKRLYENLGFDVSMMDEFYGRIEAIAADHQIPLLSLGAHSDELYWLRDPFHHGWLSNIEYYRIMYEHFGLGQTKQ